MDCLDRHISSFYVFNLVPGKKTQHKRKNVTLKLFLYTFFKTSLFKNSKNLECDALLLVFVNEIIIKKSYICELECEDAFSAGPTKSLYFPSKTVFFTFYRKSLETNFYWQLIIIILCLKHFSLRWIIKDFLSDPSPKALCTSLAFYSFQLAS